MKHLLIILSFLLLSSPVIGQSERPETIIIPVGTMGKISDSQKQIIQNTLGQELTKYFRLVPQDKIEEAQEKAFEELEFEECTEDQCIMMIQEILQVENVFSLQIVEEKGDTQLSLTWVGLDEKKIATDYCKGCGTFELNTKIAILVNNLVNQIKSIKGLPTESSVTESKKEVVEESEKSLSSEKNWYANSEKKRVRFDSSLVGNHEGNFIHGDETEKSLTLQTLSMIFKNNFGVGLSTINWAGTTTFLIYDLKNWGVNGNILDFYYMFEEKNPNTYWINQMPLSLTLGTSYPLSLEMKWGMGYKDDASLFSQLISIGVKVTDDFELILNGRYYGFTAKNVGRFNLTANTLGIGYLF